MSGGNRSYIDKARLRKNVRHKMYKAESATKSDFLGREPKYEAVSTQNASCVRVLSIAILYPRVVGKLVFLAIIIFSVVNFS